mmetsp:Transcript_14140/g.30833  ORF Transcript_14140/g.30833 Transcript_14140/m.30833 type:complete len:778 (-) Transcript_14140:74-2407(-)|eukprot:CAMPEP_0168752138 /NCGR_PEP_ID=MMETSP0724-20121128/18228_1 /TAXON_ID=265536 /ORGANISM="Amphiprora sp., Strain CCMP467" /LENGTH=777 /DNA_ID=CAMNT_0008800371 /DNA_START=301 /DNA_END=2634 /DNA_ORIENTATION=+
MCTATNNKKRPQDASSSSNSSSNKVRLSLGWMLLHTLAAGVAPYFLSKLFTANSSSQSQQQSQSSQHQQQQPAAAVVERPNWNLPLPILHAHKTPPDYTYTGACLDDPYATTSNNNHQSTATSPTTTSSTNNKQSSWSQHRVDVHMKILDGHVERLQNSSAAEIQQEDDIVDHGFDGYQPAGQHLLMDIQNVDPSFLLDTQRLASAMVEITTNSGLTLLSYHCHDLQAPMGVSCAGVLLESHVSFHTWPAAGIITLDLFTCGPASLLPLVPVLEELFAIATTPSNDDDGDNGNIANGLKPTMRWLYKKRGYRDYHEIVQENIRKNAALAAGEEIEETATTPTAATSVHKPEYLDLEKYFLGWKGYHHKGVIVNQDTGFQEVQVFEMKHSNMPLSRSVSSNPTDSKNKDVVPTLPTNKKLFLDNHAQSSLLGLEAYHEALVHPALVAHPHPRRVAIIGSGEGAALRECLKHQTVESVTMLEIDEVFMQLAREQMKEWNDCSEFSYNNNETTEDGYVSCFDDERANVLAVDAIEWFQQRFGAAVDIDEAHKFDVVIMDSFDPASPSSLSKNLYGSEEFVTALTNSLTKEGILIFQLSLSHGIEHVHSDPVFKMLQEFVASLAKHGAQSIKSYGEGHGQEWNPWDFQAVFMGDESRARWLSEASQIDYVLSERGVATKTGGSPFHYMDGATMTTYQYPSRAQEDISCDLKPDLALCDNGQTYQPAVVELSQAMDRIQQLRMHYAAPSEETVSSDSASNETSDEPDMATATTCSDCAEQRV